jgi:integrase
MRHSAITRLALSGADLATVKQFSGHESLQMVMRYTHPQDRATDEALDRLELASVLAKKANSAAGRTTPKLHRSKIPSETAQS